MKLIKYFGTWCSPCFQLATNLKSVNLEGVEFVEIDIDEEPELTAQAKVRGVPTLQLLDNDGNELSRKVGALSAPQIQQWLDSYK